MTTIPNFERHEDLHAYQLNLLEKMIDEVAPFINKESGNPALKNICQLITATYGYELGINDMALQTMAGLAEGDPKTALPHLKNITVTLRQNFEYMVSASSANGVGHGEDEDDDDGEDEDDI